MTIHIIDSVKGGSGKSTFALKLATALKPLPIEVKEKKSKPIIVDLDIMGTSWFCSFENMMTKSDNSAYPNIFLNDLVMDWNHYKSMSFIRQLSVNMNLPGEETITIDIIPCSSEQSAKEKFKIDDEDKSRSIQYDVFRSRIVKLIEYLETKEYTDIILDMPPNSEPYSNSILKQCLKEQEYNVNLYMVASTDVGHIESNINWYKNFIESYDSQRVTTVREKPFRKSKERFGDKDVTSLSWYKRNPQKLFFVLNDIFDYVDETKRGLRLCTGSDFEKQSTYQSLIYLFVGKDEEYYNFKRDLFINRDSDLKVVRCSKFYLDTAMFLFEDL